MENANPEVFVNTAKKRVDSVIDDDSEDLIDAQEVFDLIRYVFSLNE